MATNVLNRVVRHLRHSAMQQATAALRDGDLLEAYIGRRDEAAFEALVRRHGPMVLGVCQRILRNVADAEDAFQATFLVLVRKARSIRKRGAVANWLYGVAHHTALKARIMNRKRRSKELAAGTAPKPQVAEEVGQQLQTLLDGELSLLRDKYRIPIVLCDLQGKTIKEAAAHLGWPQGTVATRLRRGRSLLARRLTKHGLAFSGAVLTGALSAHVAQPAVPPALLSGTLHAAGVIGAGQTLLAGAISTKVAALTEGVLKAMLVSKLKNATAMVLVLALLGMGAGGISRSADADDKEVHAVQNAAAEGGRSRKPAGSGEERLLISSQVSGFIVDVVKLGDNVRQGDVLVRLDDRAAKADLDRARANLDAAKAVLTASSTEVALATRRVERMKDFFEQNAIAKRTYDEAVSNRDQSRARLDHKKAVVKVAEADLEKAQLVLTQHSLRSPVAGIVRTVFKQQGTFVKTGERILEIGAIQPAPARKQEGPASDNLKRQIALLEADVAELQERAAWSERMAQLGYMTKLQAQADRTRLQQAIADLEHARKQAVLRPPAGATALEGLAARFRYRVPIETGYTEFS
jgi:RNA polymerase sigma factor (sigma-70 family)